MNKVTLAATTTIALLVAGLSISAIGYTKNKAADKVALEQAQHTEQAKQVTAITLTQAADIAEHSTGGKHTGVELNTKDGIPVYEVGIELPNGMTVAVEIDGQSGVVMSEMPDEDAAELMGEQDPEILPENMDEKSKEMMHDADEAEHQGSAHDKSSEMMEESGSADLPKKADDNS